MAFLKNVESSFREMLNKQDFALSYEDKFTIMEALDHYYVFKQYQETELCTFCKKICVQKCSICGAYYCDSVCQNNDWLKHKNVCSKDRDTGSNMASVKSLIAGRNSSNSNNSFPESDCENYLFRSTNTSPFRTLINYSLRKSKESFNNENDKVLNNLPQSNLNFLKKQTDRNQSNACRSSTPINYEKTIFFNEKKPNNQAEPDKNKKGIEKKKREDVSSKPLKAIENLNCTKIKNVPTLMTTEPKEVMCTYRENEIRYWVMDSNNLLKYTDIQLYLSKNNESFETLVPKVGLLCAAKYEGEWNRAKIVSLSPKISVHFIDFGNTEIMNEEVKKLPENLESIPPLGYLIEFEEGTPNSYKSENLETMNLLVKKTRESEDGISCVKIIDGYFGETKLGCSKTNITPNETNLYRSVLDCFCEKTKGRIFLMKGQGKQHFGSVIPDDNFKAISFFRKITELNSPNCVATEKEEGEHVLVFDEYGKFQRGKVLSKIKPFYYVVLIDTGNIISTEIVYSLPDDLNESIELGAMLTFKEDPSDKIKNAEEVAFEVTGAIKNEKWPCILKVSATEELCLGFLQKPPKDMEATSTHIFLKSGSTVVLSGICSPNSFYVQPLEESVEKKMLEINAAINENTSKVQSCTSPPKVGELCCAKFEEDEFYYRAKVKKITNDVITILFVDFGNIQDTELKNLKPISEDLKKVPFLINKVTLSKVSSDSVSQASFNYINELMNNETNLILTYSNSIHDGVLLTEKESQKIVNDFLKKEEKRVSSSTDNDIDSSILTEKNLNYISLISKTDCSLCVLHVNKKDVESNCTFWATEYNNPNLVYVFGDLNTEITSYCNEITESYSPLDGEVCLAKFEGAWYRSLSLKKVEDDIFKVLFLDFGNDEFVTANSIRKIDSKFLEAPILAFKCCLQGVDIVKSSPEVVEKVYNFLQRNINSTFEGVKVAEIEKNFYLVSIAEIDYLLTNKN